MNILHKSKLYLIFNSVSYTENIVWYTNVPKLGPPFLRVKYFHHDRHRYWEAWWPLREVMMWTLSINEQVRKAPSEFNESRFISMTIYNEFLLSIFLNVSM